MHDAAIALFILSSIVSLLGGYLRDRFVYIDHPISEDLEGVCKVQKRLCIGFFIMAGLGLAFAIVNALAFAVFRPNDAEAFWTATAAGAWSTAVLALFATTYGAMQKAKTLAELL